MHFNALYEAKYSSPSCVRDIVLRPDPLMKLDDIESSFRDILVHTTPSKLIRNTSGNADSSMWSYSTLNLEEARSCEY